MKWIISACALFLAWSGQCQGGFTFKDHAWVGTIAKPTSGGGGSTNLLTSLVAYWKMDEQITSGTRADSHTNAFDLTDNNNNTASNHGAVIGYSAQFAGSAGSCLRHADAAGLKLGADTSFTLSFWVIPASFPVPGVIVDKGSAFDLTHDEFLIYYIASGQARFSVGNGTTFTNIDAATTITALTTNHIAACYSAAEQKLHLYINGTEDGASPVTWTGGTFGTAGPLSFGEASSTTGFYDTGEIDEVGYWHRALTASEVTALYNSGAGLAFSNFGSTP